MLQLHAAVKQRKENGLPFQWLQNLKSRDKNG
uniref:Uncharacterized protein n=1 Tax=Rhizophora mucronata TaxID=61149 RepID=A0A2P2NVR5_RHIMU